MRSQKSLRNKIGWHWIDSPYRCTSWMQEWQFHTFFLLQDRCNFLLLMVPLCSGRKFQKSIAVSIWRSVSFGPRCVKSWLTPVVTFGNYVHRPRPMESRLFFFLYQLFVCLYCACFYEFDLLREILSHSKTENNSVLCCCFEPIWPRNKHILGSFGFHNLFSANVL